MTVNPVTWHTSRVVKIDQEADSKSNGTHNVTEYVVDIHCSGSLVESNGQKRQGYDLWFVDVNVTSRQGIENGSQETDKSDSLSDLLRAAQPLGFTDSATSQSYRVLLAVSTTTGFFVRSHCFQERFVGCKDFGILIDRSVFGKPAKPVTETSLEQLLDGSVLMFLRSKEEASLCDEATLIEEVDARINFQWLLKDQPQQKTLALVDGHLNLESYLGLYNSAKALGVKVVLLDRKDHWITDSSFRHLYDDYIAIDMTPDEEFHVRIAEAVKAYGHVDGICGIATYSLPPVAKASTLLGLPTELPESIAMANDKHQTRLLDQDPVLSAMVGSVSDLKELIKNKSFVPEYPLIVKPTFGTGSAHVHKVDDEAALLEAVRRITEVAKRKALIETYVEGPELDANFVLVDGEILFFEMNDDFPTAGDEGDIDSDFWETINAFPTVLPPDEFVLLRDEMHRLLLAMGLKTGVFHLEAKVQNSCWEYRVKDGVYDLYPKEGSAKSGPKRCFTIEVNPRPPGMANCYGSGATYGVNFYDLHVLRMLGDVERIRALAKPFEPHPSIPYNARIWSDLFWLRADKGGVCATDTVCSETLEKLSPEDRALVTRSCCFYRRGERIPDPADGVVRLGGFFFLSSRKSRADILRASASLLKYNSIPVTTS
ncbi:hypothetical protein CEP51_005730 [Fusarium floridanum]|uniref:ATP-grasp domain-containing protein n=1 Tax=Fusarium floridanum TaxID=1325733 RepID=A0A428RVP0_9HYPO|nr:hypothetical protein CEP51_005730 [Fusarium floridanum]